MLALSLLFAGSFAHAQVISTDTPEPIFPKLQVPIPGLNFEGSVLVTADEPVAGCEPNKVCIDVIGRYINAIFRYGLGAGIIFTIVLIMIGGVEWMTGSAISSIDRGKKRIQNAALGLLFLLTVTVFFTFLNPAIVALNTLRVSTVKKAPDPPVELLVGNSTITTDIQNSEGELVGAASIRHVIDPSTGESVVHPHVDARLGAGVELLHEDMIEPLHRAANSLYIQTGEGAGGSGVEVIAGFADPAQTMRRFYQLCVSDSGLCQELVCNPLPDNLGLIEGDYQSGFALTSQATQIQSQNNWNETQLIDFLALQAAENGQRSCPYETGYAVGVICENSNERSVRDLRCQVTLEETMKRMGFCRSYFAPWHYELKGKTTSVSSSCDWIPGTMLRPQAYCQVNDSTAEDVPFSTSDPSGSPCGVNYEELIGCCVQFDLKTGRCLTNLCDSNNYQGGF